MMQRVYGWESGEPVGDFVELTIDHLFGEIWSRDTMSIRDRRLLLIGLLVGQGLDDVVELQLDAAKRLGELDGRASCARSSCSSATTPAGRGARSSTRSSRS